jgi:hypothetical protein
MGDINSVLEEVEAAREGADDTPYPTLGTRLNSENEDFLYQITKSLGRYIPNCFRSSAATVVARVPEKVTFIGETLVFEPNSVGDNIVNVYIPTTGSDDIFDIDFTDTTGFVAYGVKVKDTIAGSYEEAGFSNKSVMNATGSAYLVLLLRVKSAYSGSKRVVVRRRSIPTQDIVSNLQQSVIPKNLFNSAFASCVYRFSNAATFALDAVTFTANSSGTNVVNIYIPIESQKVYNISHSVSGLEQYGEKFVDTISPTWDDQGFTHYTVMRNKKNHKYLCVYLRATSTFSGTVTYNIEESKAPDYVYVGSQGDYTSILRALKDTDVRTKLILAPETFDIYQEYIDEYGADYWKNYPGYSSSTDYFARGLWSEDGRRIQGQAGTKIQFHYSGNNSMVRSEFSVFANGTMTDSAATASNNLTELSDVEIEYSGCRYAIHDDFSSNSVTIHWNNIVFNGTSATTGAIGGGLGINCEYLIENCLFINNNTTRDLWYHNRNTASDIRCKITITGCYGSKECDFFWLGSNPIPTPCVVSNCRFSKIQATPHDSSTIVENMVLYKFNNTELNP